MMKALFILALSGLLLASGFAEGASEALASGEFSKAAELYEKQLGESGLNADLLFNLGNARYRLGEYGPAILAYERAMLLDPRAPDIRANLAMARDAAAAFEEKEPAAWEKPLYWLGFDEWLIAGGAGLFLLAAVSLVRGFSSSQKKSPTLRALAVLGTVALLASIAAVSLRFSELDRAIVLKPNSSVRLSPFATADVVGTLPAGRPVTVEKEHDGFLRVKNGWISKDDAEFVYPHR